MLFEVMSWDEAVIIRIEDDAITRANSTSLDFTMMAFNTKNSQTTVISLVQLNHFRTVVLNLQLMNIKTPPAVGRVVSK